MSKVNVISSSSQFSKLLSANTYVITDFTATWCGPCKAIAPIFEQLATSHSQPGRLSFAKVDVDQNQDISQQYGVSAMPTFLIFKNGTVVDTIRGANPSAIRTAVSRASADASKGGAKPGVSFSSKGYTLGSESTPSRPAGANTGAGFLGGLGQGAGATGLADSMVRFFGLYFTTLFSFDAYEAAQASPFAVRQASGNAPR